MIGRSRLPCGPSASFSFALLCARRAAFFSRRRAARAWRCLAWIFLRRESVILGMGRHPLFLPRTGELDAGEPSPRNVGSSVGQLALAGNCSTTPKGHSRRDPLESIITRDQATSQGRAACSPPSVPQCATMAVPCCPVQQHKAAGHTAPAAATWFDNHGRSIAAPTSQHRALPSAQDRPIAVQCSGQTAR